MLVVNCFKEECNPFCDVYMKLSFELQLLFVHLLPVYKQLFLEPHSCQWHCSKGIASFLSIALTEDSCFLAALVWCCDSRYAPEVPSFCLVPRLPVLDCRLAAVWVAFCCCASVVLCSSSCDSRVINWQDPKACSAPALSFGVECISHWRWWNCFKKSDMTLCRAKPHFCMQLASVLISFRKLHYSLISNVSFYSSVYFLILLTPETHLLICIWAQNKLNLTGGV